MRRRLAALLAALSAVAVFALLLTDRDEPGDSAPTIARGPTGTPAGTPEQARDLSAWVRDHAG